MRLLREPLFHFALLGTVVFLVHAFVGDRLATDARHRIEITAAGVDLLAGRWQSCWQRPPTDEELRGLVDAHVREEVLYREALAVGLDENDVVVRRRMVQKMEMLSQNLALLVDPTDQELQAFFQERQEEYRVQPQLSFSQVYFNMDRRGAAGEEEARRVLAELRSTSPSPPSASERGDRFMLGHDYTLVSPDEVARDFGEIFAQALFALDPGWQGPIASAYGLHIVHVGERIEDRIPDYREIRERLILDYNSMRRNRASKALYEGLAQKYEIKIDEAALERAALARQSRR